MKIKLIFLLTVASLVAKAQWTQTGTNVTWSGNVGIGVSTPANVLDVLTGFSASTETTFFLGQNHNFGANTGRYGLGMSFKHVDGTTPGKQYFLNVWFGNERRRALAFDYLGNVAIGTEVPDAKLTVKGTIHTQEVKVDLTGSVAPDYVFAPDYKLPSLSEVSDYINKNKHLPEVPSASDMEANGVNLKEMNLILLKKIEELTLYVIEQNKKVDKQHQEIVLLKEEVERQKKQQRRR